MGFRRFDIPRPEVAIVCSALFCLVLGCERPPLETFDQAMRRAADAPEIADDLGFAGLAFGLKSQVQYLEKTVSRGPLQFGARLVARQSYADHLRRLANLLELGDVAAARRYVETHFETYSPYGASTWSNVQLTSYFLPVIKGSRTPTTEFDTPLLARPKDLLTIATQKFWTPISDIGRMRGRINPNDPRQIIPYYSSGAIRAGALADQKLELCYVKPFEAFSAQIQGSVTVDLDDGKQLRLGYDDQNGYPYSALGRYLRSAIPLKDMSMKTIEQLVSAFDRETMESLLSLNTSYVFFRKLDGPALTANNTPVVDGRTIATDTKFFPKGTLALLEFTAPDDPDRKRLRLVIDQDAGGAIRGGGRVDLFYGTGKKAGDLAGQINQKDARLWYLVPKGG